MDLPSRCRLALTRTLLLALSCVPIANAADQWVSIQVDESGTAVEYYGIISAGDLAGATATAQEQGFVRLDSVSWMDDDGALHPLHESKDDNDRSRGYTDSALFSMKHIARIVLVDKAAIGVAAPPESDAPNPLPAKPKVPRDQDL